MFSLQVTIIYLTRVTLLKYRIITRREHSNHLSTTQSPMRSHQFYCVLTCQVVITACEDPSPPGLGRDGQLSLPGQLLLNIKTD